MTNGVGQELSPEVRKDNETKEAVLRAFIALVKSASKRLDELYDSEQLSGDDLSSACLDLDAALKLYEHYKEHG